MAFKLHLDCMHYLSVLLLQVVRWSKVDQVVELDSMAQTFFLLSTPEFHSAIMNFFSLADKALIESRTSTLSLSLKVIDHCKHVAVS